MRTFATFGVEKGVALGCALPPTACIVLTASTVLGCEETLLRISLFSVEKALVE